MATFQHSTQQHSTDSPCHAAAMPHGARLPLILLLIGLIWGGYALRVEAQPQSLSLQFRTRDTQPEVVLQFVGTLPHYRAVSRNGQLNLWFDSPVHGSILALKRLKKSHPILKKLRWRTHPARLSVQFNGALQPQLQANKHRHQLVIRAQTGTAQAQIALNVSQMPVDKLLLWLADRVGQDVLLRTQSAPKISLTLHQQNWRKVFALILKFCGLHASRVQNTWFIEPLQSLLKRQRQQLDEAKIATRIASLHSAVIPIRYAKVKQLVKIIRSAMRHRLSARSTLSADTRTNTLIIRALSSEMRILKQLVNTLDKPVREVDIASRMVTVHSNISKELGVQWTMKHPQIGTTDNMDALNIQLPVAQPTSQAAFKLGHIGSASMLDLELSALEEENKGEIIATPQITTANLQPAYIAQGREIPYVESAASGATSVTFKKAELSLRVTPQITPSNGILLNLLITQNNEGNTVETPTGRAVAINTQEIKTQVLLHNGETIVLGGIYQQQKQKSVSKVPFLGDIPAIGQLFRHTIHKVQKNELLIFVTPTIVTSPKILAKHLPS
ncbi:type IV pilus secretin PilQ [Celerinatantimonas yamalensis]|uniref:Type IV pilus secretin PilQ n=1 Tax=Celerinatantimonas yamalensis TaxID=559956 RepID=A0ABW9G791_9GAMM